MNLPNVRELITHERRIKALEAHIDDLEGRLSERTEYVIGYVEERLGPVEAKDPGETDA